MPKPPWSRVKVTLAVAVVVVALDQITKIWAVEALSDTIVDLFWTLRFRLIYNTGSAFSLGEGLGRWLGIFISVAVVAMFWFARSLPGARARAVLGLLVGGAVGNLLDRLFRGDDGFMSGAVVDFIDLQWWPVFNVADMAVVCGAIAMMAMTIMAPAETGSELEAQAQPESLVEDSDSSDSPESGDD